MKLRISDAARVDADHIAAQGAALFGPLQADRYLTELGELLDLIAEFPRLGTAVPELGQGIFMRVFHANLIFYQVTDDEILITRIRHGREDWHTE